MGEAAAPRCVVGRYDMASPLTGGVCPRGRSRILVSVEGSAYR